MSDLRVVDVLPPPPARSADGHKGTFGTVIVVGGCETMVGAAGLCAGSALRGGAGLVKVACDREILQSVLVIEPCATGVVLGSGASSLSAALGEADPKGSAVLAVGPGMGRGRVAADRVVRALSGRRAVVLDADGLNLLAEHGPVRGRGCELVMTPHPGEYARLAAAAGVEGDPVDPDRRVAAAVGLAGAYGSVVALKGRRTVVTDGRAVYVNASGNAALATAGSGDVLTGVVAALMAQGMSGLEAAVLGVHVHGLAGDAWSREHGPSGLTARELAGLVPGAMNGLRQRGGG